MRLNAKDRSKLIECGDKGLLAVGLLAPTSGDVRGLYARRNEGNNSPEIAPEASHVKIISST